MKIIIQNKKGFGIIEVLIASTIIAVILFALTAAGRSSLRGNNYEQERSQAMFLAQEGVELVRQIRDTNWIDARNDTKWDSLKFGSLSLMERVPLSKCYLLSFKQKDPISSVDVYRFGLSEEKSCEPESDIASETVTLDGVAYGRFIKVGRVSELLPNSDPTPGSENILRNDSLKITAVVKWGNHRVESSEIITNWRPEY